MNEAAKTTTEKTEEPKIETDPEPKPATQVKEEADKLTVTPPFLPGQLVWMLDYENVDVKEECLGCQGGKKIALLDKTLHNCPACTGKGHTTFSQRRYTIKGICRVKEYSLTIKEDGDIEQTLDVKRAQRVELDSDAIKTGRSIDWDSVHHAGFVSENNKPVLEFAGSFEKAKERAEGLTEAWLAEKRAKAKAKAEEEAAEKAEEVEKKRLLGAMS